MIQKLTKYITPLRIIGFWMLIWSIVEYIDTEQMIKEGHEPGLGGLGFIALGVVSLVAFGLDLILSLTLKQKRNWIVQSILVLIFILWIALS
jgi:hypothetical protein